MAVFRSMHVCMLIPQGLLADELISCDQPGSTQTHLVCGDGISTGLPFQDDVNNLGKICFCDGSSRGGCRSVGDFNTEGPVIGGVSPARESLAR